MALTDRGDRHDHESESSDIKVTDRRLFTLDGTLRQQIDDESENENETTKAEAPESTSAPQPPRAEEPTGFQHRPVEEPEGIDFTMLLNGMAQPALFYLGEIAHPDAGEPQVDLEQAKLQIDMLQLLKVKCRGNLTADEDGLLDRILYRLRMLYVARSSSPAPR